MIARLIAWSGRNLLLVMFGASFAAAAGIYALVHLPLDAIPDLSDTQVIVYTEYPGQAPQVIEDQVTYPLTTAMLTVPRSKVVRGFSFFGVSFVYVIFEDGTDIYWARSRVLEFLNGATSRLPAGVTPTIGPDATGVGWVYQYAGMSKELNLADTRTIQDWNLKFALAKAEGVAEVASVGGFVKQYNVILDPHRMRDLGITMQKMRDAIRASNADVGGRAIELSEFEYVIRGKGYLKSINDLGNIVLKTDNGTPVLLRDVARVELGPDERRGMLLIIFLLLYLNFRSITETMIVMLSLPFALVGGLWLMWWLGFNLSVAVAVGFIALAGVAAETGVVMLIYLNQALEKIKARRVAEGSDLTRVDLYEAIMEGAVERVRPKMMTVVAIVAGLLPIMWSRGTGSEIMQRIAVPMIGGMISSTLLTLIVIPAIFGLVKGFRLPRDDRFDRQQPLKRR
jgi:Cu/Ag efflux pump CusA